MKAIQKITLHGNSAHVTMPRPVLFALGLRPGDFVELRVDDASGELIIRPWVNREHVASQSPGILPLDAAVGRK